MRSRSIRRFVRDRVVVHTVDDQSIRGFLAAVQRDAVVISSPEYLDGTNAEPIKGEAVVPKSNLAWMQVLGPEA